MGSEKANRRARNWCAVVYPDSAPTDWKELLDNLNIKWSCSPLHDKDTEDDGQLKKAHWHIVLCYSGNKSFEQVKDDLAEIKCPIPQICRDVTSSVRYFIHKDHPHKFQYSVNDIECHGGFDISDVFKPSKSEKTELFREIIGYIRENDVLEFFDLMNYAMDERPEDWFPLLTESGSLMLREYIKSNRHRRRGGVVVDGQQIDPETGEIIE
jgi:hypothetical protein